MMFIAIPAGTKASDLRHCGQLCVKLIEDNQSHVRTTQLRMDNLLDQVPTAITVGIKKTTGGCLYSVGHWLPAICSPCVAATDVTLEMLSAANVLDDTNVPRMVPRPSGECSIGMGFPPLHKQRDMCADDRLPGSQLLPVRSLSLLLTWLPMLDTS
jgi:hypothetical protein